MKVECYFSGITPSVITTLVTDDFGNLLKITPWECDFFQAADVMTVEAKTLLNAFDFCDEGKVR